MTLDYETLRLAAWGLLILMLVGFALVNAAELGVCCLLPLLQPNEAQRAGLASRLSPSSTANQAWLAMLISMLFVGWPTVFAVTLFSFQSILLLLLPLWLLRPFALYFRDNILDPLWLKRWDTALFLSGAVPAFLLGIMVGNLLKGIPFHLQSDMRIAYLGDLRSLFNPFALLCGATSTAMLACHAALYVQLHGCSELTDRAKTLAFQAGLVFLVLFGLAGLWITHLEGYHVITEIVPDGASNPLTKLVRRGEGLWLDNYEHQPSLWIIPAIAFLAGAAMLTWSKLNHPYWALVASSIVISMTVLTASLSMFPFMLPSNMSLNSSLTLWDASASQLTLWVLVCFGGIMLPLMAVSSRYLLRAFAQTDK